MSAITAKASRKMKKYAVLTREPRCFLGSFDFSWEQRKFSDLVQIERGGSPRPIDDFITDAPNGLNWVKIGDAPTQGNYITKTAEKIRPEGLSKTREVHPGDLILSNSMSFGKPYIMGIDGCIHDGWLLIRNTYGVFDLTFLCHLLGTPQMLSQYRSLAAGSTVNNLNKELVGNTYVTIPSITEQRVLGAYLEQLDNLITLHQRKCANLCSPSQVVFSLLFATSTFSWEQRKLGEIGSVSMCRRIFKEQTSETGDIPFYKIGTFGAEPDAFISRELFEEYKSKYPYPKKGDILISASGSIGRTVEFAGNNEYFQDSNIVWLSHDERLSNSFLKCFYSVVKWAGIEGSTIKRLYNDNILNTVICMPSVPEQEHIGLFFENLDNLITLHQRECISFTGRADRLILTANKKRTTSSWEQRKLGDVVKEITRNDPESEAPIMMITANNGFIEQSERYAFNNAGESLKKYILLKKGELAYNHGASKLRPYGSCFALTTAENARIPFVYHCFSAENQNAEFMSIELNGAEIENQLRKIVSSGARMDGLLNISFDEYTSVSVLLPGTEEQDRIADFFRHLDNLITLHQRKPFLMKWRTSDANRNQTNRLVL